MKPKTDITRRDFIRKGAIAASAPLILNFTQKSFAQYSKRTINVGIIGTGGRGRNAHLRTCLKLPDVKITALCDIRKEELEKAVEMAGDHNPKTYQNYEDLLKQKDLHCIFIATPCDLHKLMICESLLAGFSVYTEKPMAITVTDCNAIVRLARQAKGVLQVGQQTRYSPTIQKDIKLIHNGKLGKVAMIHYQRYSKSVPPERKWIHSIERGGDIIVEQAVHELDRFNWIMGAHPIRAAGLGGQNVVFEGFDTENMDHYGLILEYPENRRVIYSHCWYTVYGVDTNMNIVYGTEAVFDMNAGKIYKHIPRGVPQPEPEIIERPKERIDTTYLSIKDFFDCYKTGRKPFCDAEIGRTAVLTALLGRKAIYEKKVVTWEDLLKEGAPVKRWEG